MASTTTVIRITDAQPTIKLYQTNKPAALARWGVGNLSKYLYAVATGIRKATVTVQPDGTAGAKATGTITLTAGLAADESLTLNGVAFTAKAKYATGTIAFASVVEDNVVTVNGTAFTAKNSAAGAVQFAVGVSDAATMANFVAKVNAHTTIGALVQCTDNLDGTCLMTAVTEGASGNLITLTKTGATITLTGLSSGKLSGAYDAAANQWPVETTLALSATALATRVNASSTALVTKVVTAAASNASVVLTAYIPGLLGNAITVAGATHITLGAPISGGRLVGGTGDDATEITYSLL